MLALPILFLPLFLYLWWRLLLLFFRQQRPGYRDKPFWLLKFRSMTNARDASGSLLPDAQRLTPFGCWLRATSIDELPALINILRGEMSFIGPRPLLMQYLPLYTPHQSRRHDVKPGFSGWAQINGRNAISWDEKLDFDIWYVDNCNLFLDLMILFRTVFDVCLVELHRMKVVWCLFLKDSSPRSPRFKVLITSAGAVLARKSSSHWNIQSYVIYSLALLITPNAVGSLVRLISSDSDGLDMIISKFPTL